MKNFKLLMITLVAVGATATQNARAQDKVGNGGHQSCAKFIDFVGRVGAAIGNVEQSKIDKLNRLINGFLLHEESRKFTCLPTEELDRTARTLKISDKEIRTTLKWKDWDALSTDAKLDLAAHELAVGADLESEGQYFNSQDIVLFVRGSRQFADLKCDDLSYQDGFITCQNPGYVIQGGKYKFKFLNEQTPYAICKYLGFGNQRAYSWSYAQSGSYVAIDNGGVRVRDTTLTGFSYFGSISCDL